MRSRVPLDAPLQQTLLNGKFAHTYAAGNGGFVEIGRGGFG